MELDRDQLIDCVRRCNLNNIEETCKYCANCYLSDWDLGGFNCHDDLANEIISRLEADAQKIKELTEQSQKWQEAYDCADAACRELSSKCDELTEEIKDLEADYDRVYEQAAADIHGNMADGGTSCHWCMDKTRADTVRKMQEKLNDRIDRTLDVFDFDISECNAVRQVLRGVKNDISQVSKELFKEDYETWKRVSDYLSEDE